MVNHFAADPDGCCDFALSVDAHGAGSNLQWQSPRARHRTAMHSPFVDSTSSPPGDDSGEPLEPTISERVLMVALVVAVAACSAALLVQ